MTPIGDVIRQTETRQYDWRCSQDPEEQERPGMHLSRVYPGTVDAKWSK